LNKIDIGALSELCTPVAQVAEWQHLRSAAPSFGQPLPTRRDKNTAWYVRLSCVCRDWSDSLECTEQRPAWSRTQNRQLRLPIEDVLVAAVFGALGIIEALCDNVPYKLHWQWHSVWDWVRFVVLI